MKQLFFKAIICFVLVAGLKTGYAQNNLELNWGYLIPVNNQLKQAFSSSQTFSIAFLHPLKTSNFEAGLQFSRQHFQSDGQFFSNNYSSNYSIHNYAVLGKWYFIRQEEFNICADFDLGVSRINIKETKNGNEYSKEKSGFTTAVSADAELKLSHRLLLCAGAKSTFCFTDNLNFEDKIAVNKIISVGVKIGFKFLLRKDNTL